MAQTGMLAVKRKTYQAFVNIPHLIRVFRWPNLLIITVTQYLTAIFLIGDYQQWFTYLTDVRLFLVAVSTMVIAAGGYIINDYYDIKIDYINKPEKVVVGRIIKRRVALIIHLLFSGLGVLAGVAVTWKVGAFQAMAVFLLWLYSNQLKRLPFLGNLTVSLLTGASLLVVSLRYNDFNNYVFMYAIFAFAMTLIREIIKDMEDLKGDLNFGCKTIPIILGIRRSKWVLYIITSGFIFTIIYLINRLQVRELYLYIVIFIVPMVYFIYRLVMSDTKKNFSYLSYYCKLLMITGVLSMMLIK